MRAIFNLQHGVYYPLSEGLPDNYRGIILQGADIASIQNGSEMIIQQNFEHAEFTIQFSIYKFISLVKCILRPPAFSHVSMLALKNNIKSEITDIGRINLKAEEQSFLHFHGENLLVEFKPGKEYQILEISFSPAMIQQTLLLFPKLTGRFETASLSTKGTLLFPPHSAGKKAINLARELMDSPFETAANERYFQYKVREYLLLVFESFGKKETDMIISRQERDLIIKLKERMERDPVGKFQIDQLVKELGMNEIKLQTIFKQLTGKTIIEFHTDQRMFEARRLLKETDLSVKVISAMVGYKRPTSFMTRFRRFFGIGPSKFQQKK